MHARRSGRIAVVIAATAAAALGLASCSSSKNSSGSTDANGTAKSITIWTVQNPLYDYQKSTLADFEKSTGIKATFSQVPESGYLDKLNIAQTSKDGSFAMYMTPQSITSQYVSLKGAEDLGPYLSNTTLTPADFNLADIPENLQKSCQYQGKTYCLPAFASVPMLYYNKKIFAAAGISTPPQTMQEIVDDANKIKATGTAGYCSRASADTVMYTAHMLMPMYLPYSADDQGVWIDKDYNPKLNTPEAIKFATDLQTLLKNDGPKGIASFTNVECQTAMQNGTVGMWMDASALAPQVYDPSVSKSAADIGFDELPCPDANPTCKQLDSWGFFLNPNASQADRNAGYKLITWLAGKTVEEGAVKNGVPALATRTSVLNEDFSGGKVPADVVKGQAYGFGKLDPNLIPSFPEFNQVQGLVATQLSKIISGQSDPTSAMNDAQKQVSAQLKQIGLLK